HVSLDHIPSTPLSPRRLLCEATLINQLPLHLPPLYCPPSPVDDIQIATHWGDEARIPFALWSKDHAPARERFELTQPADQAVAAAPAPASAWPSGAGGPGSGTHQIDADLLHSALCRAAPAGTTAALHEDKFVLLRSGDQLSIAERSGRTLIAGAIGADLNLMHRVARTSGIPVMARHWLRADQQAKATRLVDRPWRTWTLRIPRRDSTMRSVRI